MRFLAHQTARRRRLRRIAGKSTESTSKPSGTIQNPKMGKKPSNPPITSKTPSTVRAKRLAGRLKVRPNSVIFMVSLS